MKIINRFLDEVCQIWRILQCLGEFHIFNKGGTY